MDRNGKLDYQEFKAMIFRSRERKEAQMRKEEEQVGEGCRLSLCHVSGPLYKEEVTWKKEEKGAKETREEEGKEEHEEKEVGV